MLFRLLRPSSEFGSSLGFAAALLQRLSFSNTLGGMPTYEYVCEKCGHRFEQFQPMSANPLTFCPEHVCPQKRWGKGKVKRAISGGAGIIFKGSGFYITDYRSDKYKEAAKKDAAAGSSAPSGGGDKKPSGDSSKSGKPEAKATPPAGKT